MLYVVGLPVAIVVILWRRRERLFGSRSGLTRAMYGFLYEPYGPTAWWWEVEELVRKLLLSAVVVLIDAGSPLQVTLAVLVCGWAHVLHGMYKPWGVGTVKYALQHGSLFTTSFVFLMGLLFKVNGVGARTFAYYALQIMMLACTVLFMLSWLLLVMSIIIENVTMKHPVLRGGLRRWCPALLAWFRRKRGLEEGDEDEPAKADEVEEVESKPGKPMGLTFTTTVSRANGASLTFCVNPLVRAKAQELASRGHVGGAGGAGGDGPTDAMSSKETTEPQHLVIDTAPSSANPATTGARRMSMFDRMRVVSLRKPVGRTGDDTTQSASQSQPPADATLNVVPETPPAA
jgi:hypothetical protein